MIAITVPYALYLSTLANPMPSLVQTFPEGQTFCEKRADEVRRTLGRMSVGATVECKPTTTVAGARAR